MRGDMSEKAPRQPLRVQRPVQTERQQRLAAALRQNIGRRKAQQQARAGMNAASRNTPADTHKE